MVKGLEGKSDAFESVGILAPIPSPSDGVQWDLHRLGVVVPVGVWQLNN